MILVTGMSGTGKSTVLTDLARRGYRVVDTDVGGWTADLPLPDGTGIERQWREDKIDALLTAHERSGVPLFVAGTVFNQDTFYPRFDEVVLLTAPLATTLDRVATRDTNAFGKSTEERDRIKADTAAIEPILREASTIEIDTRRSLSEVVERLTALVGNPRERT